MSHEGWIATVLVILLFVVCGYHFIWKPEREYKQWVFCQYEHQSAEYDFSRKILKGRNLGVIFRLKDKRKTSLESLLINELTSGNGAHVRFISDNDATKILNGQPVSDLDPEIEFVIVGITMSEERKWGDLYKDESQADFRVLDKKGTIIRANHLKCADDDILLHKIIFDVAQGVGDLENKQPEIPA